ncbi:MAG TPA: hypothetical protein VH458_08515 [Vicinamibacterales bacterium]|jgi:hypothetical protein
MSAERRPPGTTDDSGSSPVSGKKPYQKPSFVREQVFETMALACGKINPTSGICKIVKKNS